MIAETVALHARYHLAVMPPVPKSRQREAVILGNERFKVWPSKSIGAFVRPAAYAGDHRPPKRRSTGRIDPATASADAQFDASSQGRVCL